MGLVGNPLLFQAVITAIAIPAQSVGTGATVNGTAISEPWKFGRQLGILLTGGDFGAAATATLTVQGLRRSDGTTWEAIKQSDGLTDLTFTASKLADTGALENGVVLGTLDLSDVNSTTYKSLRVVYVRGAQAVACLIAAAFITYDLYTHPSATSDDLWLKLHGSPTA